MPPAEINLVLKEKRHDYGDVYTLSFAPASPIAYTAGQYAHIRVPMLAREDRPVRELSFASAPADPEIVLSVNTRSQSAYQKALLALNPSDTLGLFKIRGEMIAPASGKVVLIAHGVGMAPMRSILRDLAQANREADATLVQIDRDHYLYQSEFAGRPFPQHRITREAIDATLASVAAENPTAIYLVAGTPTFVLDIESKLAGLGIPREHVRRDVFNGLEE